MANGDRLNVSPELLSGACASLSGVARHLLDELKKLGLLVECGEEDCAQLLAELRRGGVSLVVLRGAGGLRILASGPPGTLTARVRGRLQANQRGLLRELGKEPATEAEQRAAAVTDWMELAKYELPEAAE